MSVALEFLSWLSIGAGSILIVIGGIGVLRLPDVYTRMHAAGITDTLATFLLVVGMAIHSGWSLVTFKLALIVVFAFFATPTASHALAQAAMAAGIKPQLAEDRRSLPARPEDVEDEA